MFQLHKNTAGIFIAATLVAALAAPGTAMAGSQGRKNTALALGAVTAYELLTHHTGTALVTGAGAVLAYDQYQKAERSDDRWDRRDRRGRATRVDDLNRNQRNRDRYDTQSRYDSQAQYDAGSRYDSQVPYGAQNRYDSQAQYDAGSRYDSRLDNADRRDLRDSSRINDRALTRERIVNDRSLSVDRSRSDRIGVDSGRGDNGRYDRTGSRTRYNGRNSESGRGGRNGG